MLFVERSYCGYGPGRVVFVPDTAQTQSVVDLGPVQEGEQVLLSPWSQRYVHNVGRVFADGGGAMGLYLKDANSGEDVIELDAWPQATLMPWAFSANGNRFAAIVGDSNGKPGKIIRIWDVKGL